MVPTHRNNTWNLLIDVGTQKLEPEKKTNRMNNLRCWPTQKPESWVRNASGAMHLFPAKMTWTWMIIYGAAPQNWFSWIWMMIYGAASWDWFSYEQRWIGYLACGCWCIMLCHHVLMLCAAHVCVTMCLFCALYTDTAHTRSSCADLVCSTQHQDQCAVRISACPGCTCCIVDLCAAMCWWGWLTVL
jgi:hypothetical protein